MLILPSFNFRILKVSKKHLYQRETEVSFSHDSYVDTEI